MRLLRRCCVALALPLIAACVGYEGGLVRIPYIGESPPSVSRVKAPYELDRLRELHLPGLTLNLSLNDKLRTYASESVFVIPTHLDTKNTLTRFEKDRLQLILHITPDQAGFIFSPTGIVVHVAGVKVETVSVWLEDRKKFDEAWVRYMAALADSSAAIRRGVATDAVAEPQRPDPGEWRDSVSRPVPLDNVGQSYWFVVQFATVVPAVDAEIVIDLSHSLKHARLPVIPPIRFKTIRWSESHG
jgi:hypothetical protein